MRIFIVAFAVLLNISNVSSQGPIDRLKIREDLDKLLYDLSENYIYLEDKNVDVNCISNYYTHKISDIDNVEEVVLFFENLLYEFYDSHLILNTNRKSSFRLFAPIYARILNGKAVIVNVWQSQIQNLNVDIIGAEIEQINNIQFSKAIEEFPTYCHDKRNLKVREWITNKLLAGKYNQPRVLTLKLLNQKVISLNIDTIKYQSDNRLLAYENMNGVGVIRINNSLGSNNLIHEFDMLLDSLQHTKALILDLRNTVDGGNSYVARGIMSRFISKPMPYQKHLAVEKYDSNPAVARSWVEYVMPRGKQYKKPLYVLVDRWTGSMGEGLAIGFEGLQRGQIVGTEMERLAGEMNGFSFKHQNFGYRLSTAKLFHINGIPREEYKPTYYVNQSTIKRDEILEKALELINKKSDPGVKNKPQR